MNPFLGTWATRRYNTAAPQAPDDIEITFKLDSDDLALDGSYPLAGFDGRITARIDDTGSVLEGHFEDGDADRKGQFRLILAEGGSAFFGGWYTPPSAEPYQFWVGRRIA